VNALFIRNEGRRRAVSWWLRAALGAIGTATIRFVDELLLSTALAATVLVVAARPSTWRTAVWTEQKRVLHEVAVRSLTTTIATGVLIGFALVSQAVYWLAVTGATGFVGPVIVILLIREFTPIVVGLIIFGRSGTATLIELSEARIGGWQRMIELQGLDPLVMLVIPRAFGFAIGAFCIGTVLLLTTLTTGYLLAHALGLVSFSIWDFGAAISYALAVGDFIFPPIKCMAIGFLVALSCCATALGRDNDDLRRIMPLGFVRSALAILLVNTVIDMVS
jgi:phospholipid/cholesterol/gamma-HCH transport system permease protein